MSWMYYALFTIGSSEGVLYAVPAQCTRGARIGVISYIYPSIRK